MATPKTDKPSPPKPKVSRFKVQQFTNPRTGSVSWRVSGVKRDGNRIRENFAEMAAAQCRQIELETEFLRGHAETTIRATKLSTEQLQLAEVAFLKLDEDWMRLLDAVDYWKKHGKQLAVTESPRLDDAIDQYLEWLSGSTFRDATKKHWRIRMNVFKNSVPNLRVSEVTPEVIDQFLAGRKISPSGKDTDRRAVSRFFSWCIERERRWSAINPCRDVSVDMGESKPIKVLGVDACKALLTAAEKYKDGLLAPYVAMALFGGVRPFEISRLTWDQVNLADGEIRLEANQAKTKQERVITICETLSKWLKAYHGKPFFPANWRKEFDVIRAKAGITEWPPDVLRHTAISHYFRLTGSYGLAAEMFGNSEAIIKKHYKGKVNSEETKRFYALMPKKGRK